MFLTNLKSARFWLLVIPFIIWMIAFRFFILGKGGLIADAVSYYDHIGFFTDHIAKGQYPLWDPFWYDGAPYHFFLRRIGEFNPFYLIIVLLKWFGVSHPKAYLFFLTVYYALGVAGFYLLIKYVLKNHYIAYIGYLTFLFSSWGTQLFYNYIILLFVPIVWFFYFLIRFFHERRTYLLVGISFTLGLILTTYIPFYFFTIIGLFLFLAICLYPKEIIAFIKPCFEYIAARPLKCALLLIFLVLTVVPGVQLYQESKAGEFVMPARGAGADVPSAVAVSLNKVTSGDFVNNSSFDKFFGMLDQIRLGDFYIPYGFLLLMIIVLLARMNKLIIMLFVMMSVLLLIAITQSSPIHEWLFNHVYFFKFIRNIYYFFWLAILPLAIFWVCACLLSLFKEHEGLFATWYKSTVMKGLFYTSILLLIVPQSLYVYYQLTTNMRTTASALVYNPSFYQGHRYFSTDIDVQIVDDVESSINKLKQSTLYYASRWYADIQLNVKTSVLRRYSANPLYLYDNVVPLTSDSSLWQNIENALANQANTAFIYHPELSDDDIKRLKPQEQKTSIVSKDDKRVKWLEFSSNAVRLKFNLNTSKFLVVNNNFHSKWHATINDKPVKLYRANYAYQGVWLPAGESVLYLTYDNSWTYIWHWGMLAVFCIVLIVLIVGWVKSHE